MSTTKIVSLSLPLEVVKFLDQFKNKSEVVAKALIEYKLNRTVEKAENSQKTENFADFAKRMRTQLKHEGIDADMTSEEIVDLIHAGRRF